MQRDLAPDVLRGFALLGILVVNIQFMGLNSDQGARGEWTQGFANGSATFLIAALFAGKFYLLFSFLFGYSSNYVIRNDKSNRARWIKRCLVLIAFGALHFTFLWHGDIIFLYGLFGLLLTFFFFRADRTLKIWSRIVFFLSTFFIVLIGALALMAEYLLEEDLGSITVSSLDEILRSGTFLESIPARLEVWVLGIATGIFLQGGLAFAAFLLGVRLARANFLSSPIDKAANKRLIKKGLILGLPIQIIAAVILLQNEQSAEPSESVYLISLFVSFVTAPLLSMFYVGLIRKLVEERPNLVLWMKPAGKMSLTIYISQSVITSLIFSPWGFGLFQDLQTWQVFVLAFAIWLLLSYLAAQWLKKFNQGPLESLMSSMTRSR
jgi:Predicted membrane protein